MRWGAFACSALIFCSTTLAQERPLASTQPNQFEIGRRFHFDFGPPSNFYEVFIVRAADNGSSVERITVIPKGVDECVAPAEVQIASASLAESPEALLGSTNPCTIPEKALRREQERRKDSMVLSGANVLMRVQCGAQTRLIRSDILDRDMFEASPNTPQYTSWTMRLIERLEQAVGPGVIYKPRLWMPEGDKASVRAPESPSIGPLSEGRFDALFPGAPDKPSDLYRAAQDRHPPAPSVRLLTSEPFQPEVFVDPQYPSFVKFVRVEGVVSFKLQVDSDGTPTDLTFEDGKPLLQEAVRKAMSGWKFPKEAYNQQVRASIEFKMNCPKRPEQR